MSLIDKPNIPLTQRKRLYTENHLTGKPEPGCMLYYFDEDGNELGFSTPVTPHGKINASTAGRQWSEEMKSRLR